MLYWLCQPSTHPSNEKYYEDRTSFPGTPTVTPSHHPPARAISYQSNTGISRPQLCLRPAGNWEHPPSEILCRLITSQILSLSLLESPPPHHPCTSHFSLDHNFLSDSVYLLTHGLTHISHLQYLTKISQQRLQSRLATKWMINWVSVPAVFVPIWRYLTFSLNFIMDCLSLDIEETWPGPWSH